MNRTLVLCKPDAVERGLVGAILSRFEARGLRIAAMRMAVVVEGPDGVYAVVRSMMGATNPLDSPPGTIRGDYGLEVTENLVHGSDSNASAEREIAIFFPEL